MTHLATMGTHSCATMAIGSFKGDNQAINEAYKNATDKKAAKNEFLKGIKNTVQWFRDRILMPTTQDLGRTDNYPFELLMEEIRDSTLAPKFLIATVNSAQFIADNNYWPKELMRWGFKLVDKTQNNWGGLNYIYVRNPSHRDIVEADTIKES